MNYNRQFILAAALQVSTLAIAQPVTIVKDSAGAMALEYFTDTGSNVVNFGKHATLGTNEWTGFKDSTGKEWYTHFILHANQQHVEIKQKASLAAPVTLNKSDILTCTVDATVFECTKQQ